MRGISVTSVCLLALAAGCVSQERKTASTVNVPSTNAPSADEPLLSRLDTDTTPDGRVQFFGPFNNDSIVARRTGMPAHRFVRVEFDLLVLRSWDGSVTWDIARVKKDGPDYFRVGVINGPTLLSTTFSCLPDDPPGFNEHGKFQNFPSLVPGDRLPPWSGAAHKNTLGYHYPKLGPPDLVPMDATYRINLLVPHTDPDIAVRLEAFGLQSLLDESWGFKNCRITPLADVPNVNDQSMAVAFASTTKLPDGAAPGGDMNGIVNQLIAGMDATTDWIGRNVQPRPLDGKAVAAAIHDLAGNDNHIEERDAAIETLVAFGPAVEPFLRDAKLGSHGEQRARIEQILSRLGTTPITDDGLRRVAVATRVLEVIGTPNALKLRKKLVGAE